MNNTERCRIMVSMQIEGIHQWKDCNLSGVEFLRSPHRHIFSVVCKKGVTHDDRQIEIISLKREITKFLEAKYGSLPCNFGNMSCEMIARELTNKFALDYCSVLEDNENGAEIIKE